MAHYTNGGRAEWAGFAVLKHSQMANCEGEDLQTQCRDLVTNVMHLLRIQCGLSFEQAKEQINMAVEMARQEYEEDSDND